MGKRSLFKCQRPFRRLLTGWTSYSRPKREPEQRRQEKADGVERMFGDLPPMACGTTSCWSRAPAGALVRKGVAISRQRERRRQEDPYGRPAGGKGGADGKAGALSS